MSKPNTTTKPKHLPQFVGPAEVAEALNFSRRTLERKVRQGKFPLPVQLSPNRIGWKVETIEAHLDEISRGLQSVAVANPEDLSADELGAAGVELIARAIEHEIGEPVDPSGIKITYGRTSAPIPLDQLKKAEAQELSMLQQQMADYSPSRAFIMAAYLFPAMRPMIAEGAITDELRRLFCDDDTLRELALDAMNEVSWDEEGLPKLKALASSDDGSDSAV